MSPEFLRSDKNAIFGSTVQDHVILDHPVPSNFLARVISADFADKTELMAINT